MKELADPRVEESSVQGPGLFFDNDCQRLCRRGISGLSLYDESAIELLFGVGNRLVARTGYCDGSPFAYQSPGARETETDAAGSACNEYPFSFEPQHN